MRNAVRPASLGETRGRIGFILAILLAVGLMVGTITFSVVNARGEVAENADRLDDARTGEALHGAMRARATQLQTTVQDYAFWADAAEHVYSDDRAWIGENIGVSSANADIFDTVLVVDAGGGVVDAYAGGTAQVAPAAERMAKGALSLLEAVQKRREPNNARLSGYLRIGNQLVLGAISYIHDPDTADERPAEARRYLLGLRHLDDAEVDNLARNYLIPGLVLHAPGEALAHFVPVLDLGGDTVAKFTWTSREPGSASYRAVRPTVLFVLASVGLFLLLLLFGGVYAIRKLRAEEAAARHLAETDRLSGLLNRAGFFHALDHKVAAAAGDGTDVVLIYLDLDGFKEVNDAYGHAIGDQLIMAVSAGLRQLMPQGALLARLGGDEFAFAVKSGDGRAVAERLTARLLGFFDEPFLLGDRSAIVGASIGIAFSERGRVAADELVRRADMAMYQAKECGRGRGVTYDLAMDTNRMERNALELDLRAAIEAGRLDVAFQPVVDAHTHRVSGVEALARWDRPGHGPVPPDVFIPVAEKTGLIEPLGLFVLNRALRAAARWGDIKISVNVSPGQFRNPGFAERVRNALAAAKIAPERLTLEVTEGYFIQNPGRARLVIDQLKALGVQIALDDFGAGFSSVGYLRQFGFNRMKIDRTLVTALEESARGREMLHATVALARSLDIPVTAEGIEREEQAFILELCGCDELQGYFFGRPVPAEEIGRMIEAGPGGREIDRA